jgi:lipoprotein-anchoring transpeptidase ErfK/SrfK
MNLRKGIAAAFIFLLGLGIGKVILAELSNAPKPLDFTKLTGLYSPDEKTGVFHGIKVAVDYIPPSLAALQTKNVLGASTDSNKRIEVDLTNQRLYAFDGNDKVFDFSISSGKWAPTPTGEFTIWGKFRYVKMEGGSQLLDTYYNLPNVPYTMFFYNHDNPKTKGFGLHGTYWHNNFGHPMSHGCINMKTDEAAKLYYWSDPDLMGSQSILTSLTNPGTRVVIYGTAPQD